MIDRIWANAIIKSCLNVGIDHFFVAPGSRCTPLTLAIAGQPDAKVIQHFDERGLAYAALGFGKATGRPGVFVCTSGTAVANAFPAVIESSMEKVPLLLFTADRPSELHGTGANQTIDQQKIFGNYPELALHMPVPQDQESPTDPTGQQFLSESIHQAFSASNHGPVHLNWMFREPFTISKTESNETLDSTNPPPPFPVSESNVNDSPAIQVTGNLLIALGSCRPAEAQQAVRLAKRLNSPLLSDVTSGVNAGSFELPVQFSLPRPDTILHLGGRIVSKSWLQWTDSIRDSGTKFIHVSSTGQSINPNRLEQDRYRNNFSNLDSTITGTPTTDDFRDAWQSANDARNKILDRELANSKKLNEPAIAFLVSKNCPPDNGLFVGNSMPIRDIDWFASSKHQEIRLVEANRGASGIDGLIATAVGYACGIKRPTSLVLGDLSTLHDINSLALLGKSQWPLIVIVINNQAGHIFDQLPIRDSQHFEQFFATPHTFHFEHAAKMFQVEYCCPKDCQEFADKYCEALKQNRTMIFELKTDRQYNTTVRQKIKEEVQRCSDQT